MIITTKKFNVTLVELFIGLEFFTKDSGTVDLLLLQILMSVQVLTLATASKVVRTL